MKRCSKCKVFKDESEFGKSKSSRDGLNWRCLNCATKHALAYYHKHKDAINKRNREYNKRNAERRNDITRKWSEVNKDRIKLVRLRREYGVTPEQYTKMLEDQEYKCAICREWFNHNRKECVDHDHGNKTVRGLLCNSCNSILGFAKDREEILENAVQYLRRYKIK